ncbi:MAG: hypothetical protein KatS3mg108_3082 [Isosphaeraceae bacterium]|nr:MAG: hypothetical protein KatS3mg108_3082 [Isosphaeraceae bacterium]
MILFRCGRGGKVAPKGMVGEARFGYREKAEGGGRGFGLIGGGVATGAGVTGGGEAAGAGIADQDRRCADGIA